MEEKLERIMEIVSAAREAGQGYSAPKVRRGMKMIAEAQAAEDQSQSKI
eukprot:CAMPEP_0170472132 /NCGR_PEP_ID=MMETSP0123-20130129/14219_1 /TAXON_ID=182087 /ORGANISM="Favella ehrenbergii, Strain Fehren 1" /LENGTH=48 /DNA_ID= /DNA_START= /DNA_END= /DNA_ORIENTATION=